MSVFETNVIHLPKPNYEYITTEAAARTALSEIANYKVIEVDSETTSLDPHEGKMSLFQIGVPNKVFVFDVRSDTEHSSVDLEIFKPLLTNKTTLKLFQNAVFDMKYIKKHGGYYVNNIYDTMITEQLFNLGLGFVKADLGTLVMRYLGITMDKEPRGTFMDYNQVFKPFQLEYAANDVVILDMIRNLQAPRIQREGFENVCRLEFEFVKPMCEMELNGITFDKDKHRVILDDIDEDRVKHGKMVSDLLNATEDQTTLFGVSLINIDSNVQLKKALKKYGLELESTDVATLDKFKGIPVIDELLSYRKAQKFISTYGESLMDKVNEYTGRLHTRFRQMVSTGRMSSSAPNLQNIPKKQIYRSCYIAKEGHSLITADMSGAELRILGNLSADSVFVECYANGIDLHTRTASEVFGIPFDQVKHNDRNAAKAINFGLCASEDTNIITDLGTDKIKNVLINSSVCHDIGLNKVIDKQYMGEKEVFEVKTQYGYTLEVTEDHLIKIINSDGEYVDKELKNLDIDNDYVCLKKASNLFPKDMELFDDFEVERVSNYKHLALPKILDERIAAFLGLFVSEGSLLKVKGRQKYSYLQFGFSDACAEFINEIDNLFYLVFGSRFNRKRKNGIVRYKMSSVLFGEWLAKVCDLHGNDKTGEIGVPDSIKKSPEDIQSTFLKWLFEGDGSAKIAGNSYSITYSSKSYNLVNDLQLMLLNFGVLSSIRSETRKNRPGELYWEIKIVSNESRINFLNKIGFLTSYKNDRCVNNAAYESSVYFLPNQELLLDEILRNRTKAEKKDRKIYDIIYNAKYNTTGLGDTHLDRFSKYNSFFKFIYDNGIVPLPIKSIKSKGIKRVYDLSVENHQYFLANGFIIHNCYGLSKYGLARRLKISENEAGDMINSYFKRYVGVKRLLDQSAKSAVMKRHSKTVSGRKRFYRLPEYGTKEFDKKKRAVEREGKNAVIQGANADTIKEAMILAVKRLEERNMKSKLLLTVHDELVIEAPFNEQEEAKHIAEQSLIDGFAVYFDLIPMESDALSGPCWLKNSCEDESTGKECGGTEMEWAPDKKYKTKIVCKKCGAAQ